jgi:hypothetical protein
MTPEASKRIGFTAALIGTFGLAFGAGASAEPMFLSKQYTRCTTCHYSPTGGGLLTPYGRALSHHELSTFRGAEPPGGAGSVQSPQVPQGGEQDFLWGALGSKLGPVSMGIDLRPAHLSYDVDGTTSNMNFWMTADVLAAYQVKGWTLYGEIGRQPLIEGAKLDSYEYWVQHQNDAGLAFRVGRFLPAFGVRLADHSAFTRSVLGFDKYDQVYALEVSRTLERYQWQVSVGPGRADSIIHNDGRQAFTATGRFGLDLGPRRMLVLSGLYRDASQLEASTGAADAAFGIAPTSRLSIWTEGAAQFQKGTAGAPQYVFMNETAFEAYHGLWLKFSPQLRTVYGDPSGGVARLAFEADFLPRTHWNVDFSFYRDRYRGTDSVTKIFLFQLHLYL